MRLKKSFMIPFVLIFLFSCVRNNDVANENVPFIASEIEQASNSTFFCTVYSLRIRSEPTVDSIQIGSLRLFDMATIIEKTEIHSIIDGIGAYWYKISFNDIQGYIFGGFGIVLEEKYEIKSIDDFGIVLSSLFEMEELSRTIVGGDQNNPMPTVILFYDVTFMNHIFRVSIYYRTILGIDISDIGFEHNLVVREPANIFGLSNHFGRGSSYRILTDLSHPSEVITTPGIMATRSRANDIITNHGNYGRYFFASWGSELTYDIANFLFKVEENFDNIFSEILITAVNLWLNPTDFENIQKIDNTFIEVARSNRVMESLLFQIFNEIILRLKIR